MTGLLLPLVIGIAFGFTLERAGLGNARKLTGQFFLTDLTVFKVMFSAIVTAMLGLFWCSRLGWVDLNALALPETYLRPQLAGGLIFGAGFGLAGLCPGTSCVAAASGRGDGLAVVGGLFAGVLGAGLSFPLFVDFYDSDARGAWTLPSLLHLPYGTVVLAISIVAILGFIAAEAIEGRAQQAGVTQAVRSARTSARTRTRARIAAVALAVIVAALAAIARTPENATTAAAAQARTKALYKPPSGC
ncbi:MAG TPA: DUF6691 family protein [Vicinamibacterales bacterium]|nr:DUF6691 family protein [Vicinamibacterales bacterium]